jgi:hypothetical protein
VLAWLPRLALPLLSVLLPLPAAGETQEASLRSGEVVRAGCVVRVAELDARGIAGISAECRWPVAPRRVVEIIRDHDGIDAVLSSLSESRVLPDGRVVHVYSMGRLAAERQVTLRFRSRELEDGGLRIEFDAAPEQQRPREGRVQVAVDQGWWEIRSDGAGGTRLRYAVRYDAGGHLKPWIARRFQKAGVVRSLREIRHATEAARSVSAPPPAPR